MKPINKVLEINQLLNDPFRAYPQLSKNERIVGRLAIQGYSNIEIAEETSIPHGTVILYMTNVCRAVGCSKSELVRKVFLKELKAILDDPAK